MNEATALRSLQWSAAGLPVGAAATLHRQLDAYLNEVVSNDWPQMRHGRLGDESERMIAAMYASALRVNPATNAQSAARQNVVGSSTRCSPRAPSAPPTRPVGSPKGCSPRCWPPRWS